MKNRFNSQIVKLPKSGIRTRDLSGTTITSMPFFQNSPVFIQEVIPGDDISLNCKNFVRLNTMQSPTFGRVTIRNRVFFVPFRTVWSRFDEFITQTPKDGSLNNILQAPKVFESNFIYAFVANQNGLTTQGDSSNYSFVSYNAGDLTTPVYRTFTRKGRFLYRILVNLGYNINFPSPYSQSSNPINKSRIFSALPLLAFYRIWCDFFQYKMSENYREYDPTLVDSSGQILTYNLLYPILDTLCTRSSLYDDDYFTLAGESPDVPIYGDTVNSKGAYQTMNINGETLTGDNDTSIQGSETVGQGGNLREPAIVKSSQTMETTGIGASAINFVQRAADYFRRKFNGGSTVVQQYLNEYGIELKSEEITHSKHLGSFETPINVMDVTGTSGTDFGAQTSMGRGAGVNSFHWKADEFGYIIVTSVVVAHAIYGTGTPRFVNRLMPLDFYHPDFDGLGMQAVRQDEISSGAITGITNYNPSSVFGFLPRYADYKCGHDTLSGVFVEKSSRAAYSGYYLMRGYYPENYSSSTPPHAGETFRNPNINQNGWTPTSFDSIFLNAGGDNFLLFYQFDMFAKNSVRPLLDSYDWYSDGDSIHMQGGANAFGDN